MMKEVGLKTCKNNILLKELFVASTELDKGCSFVTIRTLILYVSQVVNRSAVVTWAAPTEPPGARNPAPGVCLPVIVSFCQQHRVSYNFTVFPNYIGHFGQRDAQQVSHSYYK
ncbi:hypothetical protein ACJJTC_001486 [Scirpophaga incertulas]